MDMTHAATLVGLLVALSVASERLVEIIKGLISWLDEEKSGAKKEQERLRRAALQGLAVVAGILTSCLSWTAISSIVGKPELTLATGETWVWIVGLGLLASGGSGFWNAVLTYVLTVKDLKEQVMKNGKP